MKNKKFFNFIILSAVVLLACTYDPFAGSTFKTEERMNNPNGIFSKQLIFHDNKVVDRVTFTSKQEHSTTYYYTIKHGVMTLESEGTSWELRIEDANTITWLYPNGKEIIYRRVL